MATKTFKVGEYGYHPKIKVTTMNKNVRVQLFNWEGELDETRHYSYEALNHLELDMCEECSSYYASLMVEFVHSTVEYKASFEGIPGFGRDPLSTFTFNLR